MIGAQITVGSFFLFPRRAIQPGDLNWRSEVAEGTFCLFVEILLAYMVQARRPGHYGDKAIFQFL